MDEVIVIGGGQAGLAMSHELKARDVLHTVLEARPTLGGAWQDRWESFCLVTPNFACRLPGFEYAGPDPDGYMLREELIEHVRGYAASFDAPAELGVRVTGLRAAPGGFELSTSSGSRRARRVVVATGAFQRPYRPAAANALPESLAQLHSHDYRNESALAAGGVLIVGSGQSGTQIAEELHAAGRSVFLSVGSAGRAPRRYRGRDSTYWLFNQLWHGHEVGVPARTVDDLPTPAARFAPIPHVSGTKGGHDIYLRRLGNDGVTLTGHLIGSEGATLRFAPDAAEGVDRADRFFPEFMQPGLDPFIAAWDPGAAAHVSPEAAPWDSFRPTEVDELDVDRAGISTVIWASGYRPDFGWIDLPILDEYGYPRHRRGVSEAPGLAFLGLPWLYNQGSSLFAGSGRTQPTLRAP